MAAPEAAAGNTKGPRHIRIACVQPNIGDDMAANIAQVCGLIREAHAKGAEFVTTPENSSFMGRNSAASLEAGKPEATHPALKAYRELAAELKIWLLIGSISVREDGANRNANRSYLVNPQGEITATYDKIHMFDVDLPNGEVFRESNTFAPGEQAVLADHPQAKLGLSICYDVRFPQLYRGLAQAGAEVIMVPAAFTRNTGQAHWHILLRARAIETGAFVVAPAMWGDHPGKRQTYGHSLIIDPWGRVLADAGEGTGVVLADIDLDEVAKARGQIPAWLHEPRYSKPITSATKG